MRVAATITAFQTVLLLGAGFAHAEDPLQAERARLDARYREQLAELAVRSEALGLPEQASITRNWFVTRNPKRQYLFLVPTTNPTQPPGNASKIVRQWHDKLMEQRRMQAEALWGLAEKYLAADRPTMAYQQIHEVVREDPDHSDARRALGYRRVGDRWSQTRESVRPRTGRTSHRDFGWRRNRYWRIDSPHFRVTTSQSGAAGMELAKTLEELHTVWRQLFFRYWSSKEDLRERMAGRDAFTESLRRYEVVLFRDREEYVQQLGKYERQIGITMGYYAKGRRTSFFYAGDQTLGATWFHEGTHQLFQESGNAISDPGEQSNFWIVEGIALYMESLVRHQGYYSVGGFDADRLQYARARRFRGEFHMPIAELVRLGREDLQQHAELRRIYTQAAGLAHLLMDGENGRFRGRLVNYLTLVYLGRDNSASLLRLGGPPPDELDRLYPEFLSVDDRDLRNLDPERPLRNLALGRTSITDQGLAVLAERDLTRLEWLDLSFTEATDAGLAYAAEAVNIRQLSLQETQITDRGLETIGRFGNLEELDLSGTQVTDDGLAYLERLPRLRLLWLTGSRISNAALPRLLQMKNLERLDISNTEVTADAWRQLQEQLPKLTVSEP
ncbi:MAG: leucine-rich repeat domain-containing protein [Pirellulaceae bacterium]